MTKKEEQTRKDTRENDEKGMTTTMMNKKTNDDHEHDHVGVYEPAIFRFTCTGSLIATTDGLASADPFKPALSSPKDHPNGHQTNTNSDANGHVADNGESAVFCQGLQSRLEHTLDLERTTTTNDAVAQFEKVLSHTSIPIMTPPPPPPRRQRNPSVKPTSRSTATSTPAPMPVNQAMVSTEDLPFTDITCLGKTKVHVLVVRDVTTQQDRLMGIAPDCKFGYTSKEIGHGDGTFDHFHTVRVGSLEATILNHIENIGGDMTHNQQHAKETTTRENRDTREVTPVIPRDHENEPIDTSMVPSTNRTRERQHPVGPLFVSPLDAMKRVYKASGKVMVAMQKNALFLGNTLTDGFPSRMVGSGQKIVGQFGPTYDRTTKLMKTVYKRWFDGWNEGSRGGGFF